MADPLDDIAPRAFDAAQVDTMPIVLPTGISLWEWTESASA